MPSPAFAFENATLVRGGGGGAVLHDLTWAVRPGETWAVAGPTACGKTTLLEAIRGKHRLTAGTFNQPAGSVRMVAFKEDSRTFSYAGRYYQQRYEFADTGESLSLAQFLTARTGADAGEVTAVATDMSKAFIKAVRENLPKAIHVFDRFHVVKLYNTKLRAFRNELFRALSDATERKLLKGTLWLILKNPENLDAQRNEAERLQEALEANAPLALAYYMKEDHRQVWSQTSKAAARRHLDDWIRRAEASDIRMLERFAATLREHRDGILAYYDCRISTGPLEGVNNKIRTLQRQAYGYRDLAFFKLKLLALHQSKYALVG